MDAVFRIIWTTSLAAGVVGIVLIILKAVLRKKISPKWHYLLWAVLIMKLIVPFGPESALSLFNVVKPASQEISLRQVYEQYRQPISYIFEENSKTKEILSEGQIENSAWPEGAEAGKIIPYIWLGGAVIMLAWLVFSYSVFLRRLKARGRLAPEKVWLILEKCQEKTGIKGKIEIIVQDVAPMPSLIGVVRPKILLTPAILELSEQEVSYILQHELAHHQRKDILANYLLLGLQVIHWFNPVIWYCFLKIREDMEAAADESVLALLKASEHKEYGKALLAVLESFSLKSKLAPRLVGMVDERKNIERRIKMIKMAEFFQNKRRRVIVTGIVCLLILGGVLWTNASTSSTELLPSDRRSSANMDYNPQSLLQFQTDYVGDHVKVIQLIDSLSLPYGHSRQEVSLQTKEKPYGVAVDYYLDSPGTTEAQMAAALKKNALVMFALIKNVDVLDFHWQTAESEHNLRLTRAELEADYPRDLREYGKDTAALETLLNSFSLGISVSPAQYTPALSSVPGMKIDVRYNGSADQVKYSVKEGNFLTWGSPAGKVTSQGKDAGLPSDTSIYWSPLENHSVKYKEDYAIPMDISVWEQNSLVAERRLTIWFDGSFYYPLNADHLPAAGMTDADQDHPAKPQSLEEAVSQAVKAQGKGYLAGEFAAEGHVILDVEEKEETAIAYTVATFTWFGFENGIFTGVSGSGAIPTVITFAKNQQGEYSLVKYQEPLDGAGYAESIKKMFPRTLLARIQEKDHFQDLTRQLEEQAKQYLKSIGRTAEVKVGHVEKELMQINVDASNKLFAEYTKKDPELNKFPYWLGTKEYLVNGERYIYETSQEKTKDGYDLISFQKRKEDGTLVLEYRYLIRGSEPALISIASYPELEQ